MIFVAIGQLFAGPVPCEVNDDPQCDLDQWLDGTVCHVQSQDASMRVTENMANASAAEMRSTTDHVTNAIILVAATASQNAATAQDAALQLALGIAEIDATAQTLRAQAEQLEGLVARFTIEAASADRRNRAFASR